MAPQTPDSRRDVRVSDPLTASEFDQLTDGDIVDVYLPDYEDTVRCLVDGVSASADVIHVNGEHRNQTIHRSVHRALVWSPSS